MGRVIKNAESGHFGIVQLQEDGRIMQIGLTESQNELLKVLLSSFSDKQSLVLLPNEYELVLKSDN